MYELVQRAGGGGGAGEYGRSGLDGLRVYNSRLNQSVTREYGDRSSPARESNGEERLMSVEREWSSTIIRQNK